MPRMTEDEMRALLETPQQLVRVGSVDEHGQPAVLPVWYLYRDDRIYVTLRAQTAFMQNFLKNPKACFAIDEPTYPYRKVIVSGEVEVLYEPGQDDAWRDLYRDVVLRYFDESGADFYLDATRHLGRYLIALPCRYGDAGVVTWRQPVGDEDATGWWPSRYGTPVAPA
jgi:nitroimidazol reductase NimA-like FMN-containing flavoprotein (pyridoxamine 5'-phosphate oxidase superfamily)